MAEQHSEEDWRKLHDEIKKAVLRGFPNPERIGCPGTEVLTRLVARELPVNHPAYKHVMECSPCYQELIDIQAALPHTTFDSSKKPSRERYPANWIWVTVFIVVL